MQRVCVIKSFYKSLIMECGGKISQHSTIPVSCTTEANTFYILIDSLGTYSAYVTPTLYRWKKKKLLNLAKKDITIRNLECATIRNLEDLVNRNM